VGTSGSSASRDCDVTASACTLPPLICGSAADAVANISTVSPVITDSTAGGAPLYGTWLIATPVRSLKVSPDRCPGLPTPPEA